MTRGSKRIIWISASFLLIALATRIGLAFFSGEAYAGLEWVQILGVGLLFDLAVLPWILLPWALYDAVVPATFKRALPQRLERIWVGLWAILYVGFFAVIAFAEFAFWEEFGSRFDFIAVDYLIYTHEVIGNIRESYPVELWLAAIFVISLVVWRFSWPHSAFQNHARWPFRWARVALVLLALGIGLKWVNVELAAGTPNAYVKQLSMNGLFTFGHSFRSNELDYARYYPTLEPAERTSLIRDLLRQRHMAFTASQGINRKVTADRPAKKVNVVLISIESLSADFLGKFGNKLNLTPEFDALADKGIFYTKFYATGTRTVRGLEALSVGTPPTPGQSIVRRPNSNDLKNLGSELKQAGWKPYWVYGGHGFFDNMNAYFQGNHYKVVDRSDMEAEALPIHSENIWGIADEDLYSLAMKQFDREHARDNLFFAHIMTTSNHRPYTFPENRVDERQGRREGAVKYSDWAVGDFLKRAAKKPWFSNTLFIITADHTAKAAGKTDLPLARYHIPMVWYAPGLVKPQIMSRMMSQIDLAPTLLGWLGQSYQSRFFGYDMFNLEPGRERAFISTYQKLGYLKGGRLVVLDVNSTPTVSAVQGKASDGIQTGADKQLINEAIAWYESASFMYQSGLLKNSPEPETANNSD